MLTMEIEQVVSEIFRQDWMDDDDWAEAMELFEKEGYVKQIEEAIEVGVKNGYSLEQQIKIVKLIYK